jgi:hypothetical protein
VSANKHSEGVECADIYIRVSTLAQAKRGSCARQLRFCEQWIEDNGITRRSTSAPSGKESTWRANTAVGLRAFARSKMSGLAFCPAVFDRHVAAFNVTVFAQPFEKGRQLLSSSPGRSGVDESNYRHRQLLRETADRARSATQK